MFNSLFLLGFLLVLLGYECSLLHQVPVDLYNSSHGNICDDATSFYQKNHAEHLCLKTIYYPKVKSFLIGDGICLSKEKKNVFQGASIKRESKLVNLTGCVVWAYTWHASNLSCLLRNSLRYLSLSKRPRLAYAVLDCSKSLKRHGYCLILSLERDNLTSCVGGRMLVHSSPLPTRPTSVNPDKVKEVSIWGKVSEFIKTKPLVMAAITVGIILLSVLIVVYISCRCYKRKKMRTDANELRMESLSSLGGQDREFRRNGSKESVVYVEPDFVDESAPEVAHSYDYPYAHRIRADYSGKRDRCEDKATKSEGDRDRYSSLNKDTETEPEYESLSENVGERYENWSISRPCPSKPKLKISPPRPANREQKTSPPCPAKREQKQMPIYYVKVL